MNFKRTFLILMLGGQSLLSTSCGFFLSDTDLDTIDLSPESYFAVVGETKQFTATGTTVGGDSVDSTSTVTWSSSSTSVATISSTGLATAASNGSGVAFTTIKAKTGTASQTTSFNVGPDTLSSITLSPSTATVVVGYTRQLSVLAKFADNSSYSVPTHVTWTSSDTSVAKVSSSGLVTAVASGSATITITAEYSGGTLTDTSTITVSST